MYYMEFIPKHQNLMQKLSLNQLILHYLQSMLIPSDLGTQIVSFWCIHVQFGAQFYSEDFKSLWRNASFKLKNNFIIFKKNEEKG